MSQRVRAAAIRRDPLAREVPKQNAGTVVARGLLILKADAGSRTREALALQRLAGNHAVGQAITATRELDGHFEGHGECSTPEMHCTAKADREHTKNLKVGAPAKKKDKEGNVTYKATGTVTSTFKTKVSIDLATVPDGLSDCAAKKVGALIKTKLKPHEEDHKRRFLTTNAKHSYVGTWTKSLSDTSDDPATAQSSVAAALDTALDEEVARRIERNDDYAITAIDPFQVTADISSCPECASDE